MSSPGLRVSNEGAQSKRQKRKQRTPKLIVQLGGSKTKGLTQTKFIQNIERQGILCTSPMFAPTKEILNNLPDILRSKDLENIKAHDLSISRALEGELVIKNFPNFTNALSSVFKDIKKNDGGHVATYIPQLAKVNPDQFGAAVCSIDGQQWKKGDADVYFSLQSVGSTITYILALEEHGKAKVHSHVGIESNGASFNELLLNEDNLPHNPFINAGGIMCCSLIKPKEHISKRFDYVMNYWSRITGGGRPSFANSTYLSERSTSDRNHCLAYMMNECGAFPLGTDINETLDFYFMLCSIEITANMLAVAAGTLASGGVCPVTGERIFQEQNVRNCLSMMASCGLYNASGEFGFDIGFPAKSGVGGGLMIVIPGITGASTWSPRLESHGNSYRGVRFCKELAIRLDYHQFSILNSQYVDELYERVLGHVGTKIMFSVSRNDLRMIQILLASDPLAIHYADYCDRTALHIAASDGHLEIVKYLVAHGAKKSATDSFNNTPFDDAKRLKHKQIEKILSNDVTFPVCYGGEMEINNGIDIDLFASMDHDANGFIATKQLISLLSTEGIIKSSYWKLLYDELNRCGETLKLEDFEILLKKFPIIRRCVTNNLAIVEWSMFRDSLLNIYQKLSLVESGFRSESTQKLAAVNPEGWEVSFCSTSGQLCNARSEDSRIWHVRSIAHIINYLIAQELLGEETVHKYVGKESSGRSFNEFSLNTQGKPHNPAITSGALAIISLIKPEESNEDRFAFIRSQWQKLTLGLECVEFDEESYIYEKDTVTRKWTLGYLLLESGAFPDHIKTHEDLSTTMQLYFMTLSLLVSTEKIAIIASVLANGGVNPFTSERIFTKKYVRNVLSIMYACGMYDSSGEFAFRVGIPAQSGEGGGIMEVIPDVGGFCTWSPLLDKNFNSVRGVQFCCELTKQFNFHSYETMVRSKKDPCVFGGNWDEWRVSNLLDAASKGNLAEVKKELSFVDINSFDYDNRTVLHIAAANNRKKIALYLINHNANCSLKDRWGNTPYDCAKSTSLRQALIPHSEKEQPEKKVLNFTRVLSKIK